MTDEVILERKTKQKKQSVAATKTTSLSSPSDSTITEQQVAEYLKGNPDFFVNWENILVKLKLPHHTGDAISLVERQVAILRDHNMDLRNRFSEIIEAATENDALFEKCRQLSLTLIESGSLLTITQHLQESLKKDFGVDKTVLFLYGETTQDISNDDTNGFTRSESQADTEQALAGLLRGHDIVCSALREDEAQHLFNGTTSAATDKPIASAALIPLHYKGELGLLVVGSYDANHFSSNIGTLFINHIGEMLSRIIRPYFSLTSPS